MRTILPPWWTTWLMLLALLVTGAVLVLRGGPMSMAVGSYLLYYSAATWVADRRGRQVGRPPYQRLTKLVELLLVARGSVRKVSSSQIGSPPQGERAVPGEISVTSPMM